MEILSPATYLMNSNWLIDESRSTKWTAAENKIFENALAVYDRDTPDRWQKVAAMIPGKTVRDVMKQYKKLEDDVSSIEAGLIPFPGYGRCSSPFTLEWGNSHGGFKQCFGPGGKRSRPSDQERKKGIPWTEKEHKLFLLGLTKYGKGDWRNISRNFVITRTPTQVASHAQKYFIRQLSGGKDKRRASIHDITTVNLNENQTHSPENRNLPSPDRTSVLTHQTTSISRPQFQWNQPTMEIGFHPTHGNLFMSPFGMNSNGMKMQGQNFQYVGAQNMGFQMNSAHQYPHG